MPTVFAHDPEFAMVLRHLQCSDRAKRSVSDKISGGKSL
jgi:hypothetical protein